MSAHVLSDDTATTIRRGTVIPAHPLLLTEGGTPDWRAQNALTRYYVDAGVGGIAIGVHTTQFAIRQHGLYEPVLRNAIETAHSWSPRPLAMVAGVIGDTPQAVAEATTARELGYSAALLNVASWRDRPESDILEHCRMVGSVMPLIGFALLPEVGGFHLSAAFWREFARIESVVAIKMAPFNRYRTLDIMRAVVEANAEDRITLYTGNDDHIVLDLITPFVFRRDGRDVTLRIRGGLLGHWSVWTQKAVELLDRIHAVGDGPVPAELLALDSVVTDCNGAIYDALNDFSGCVPGLHEVLRRQGLAQGTWCLDPDEVLSVGQLDEIDRVYASHPDMYDDEFVRANLTRWLAADAPERTSTSA